MNENMFYHSSSKLIRNYYSALLFAIFFVLPPACTPVITVLYPASHKLVLCLCETVIFVICWYESAPSQNLLSSQYCYQMESTMFRAIRFVYCTVYSLQCTVLQNTILKGTKMWTKRKHWCVFTAVCVHFGWVKCRAQIPSMGHHTWPYVTFTSLHFNTPLKSTFALHNVWLYIFWIPLIDISILKSCI